MAPPSGRRSEHADLFEKTEIKGFHWLEQALIARGHKINRNGMAAHTHVDIDDYS